MKSQLSGYLFGICVFVVVSVQAADWPQWRGPNRDGISSETGWTTKWPADGPQKPWKLNVGPGCSSVAASGGRVFAMGNQNDTDTVYCLDAKTGAIVWKHSYSCRLDPNMFEGGPASTPVVDGKAVYTLSREGQLFCLSADKGTPMWSVELQKDFSVKAPTWGYAGSPLVYKDLLVVDVGASEASTVAFAKNTGKVVWKSGNEKASYSSPVPLDFKGKPALAVFNAFGLVVKDPANGADLARYPWKTSYDVNAATPIVCSNTVFIASGYSKGGALLKLDTAEPTVVWESKSMKNKMNSSVLWKGHVYGFDEGTLTCLDFTTGTSKWAQGGLGEGSLMIADGKLIVLSDSGDLVIADAVSEGFKEIARAKVLGERCWVVPVLANGHIYCKNNKGDLVCVDVTGK